MCKTNGKFIISLDCELLWGSHYYGGEERFRYLTNGFRKFYVELLELFTKYDIRATFALVGGMSLQKKEFLNIAHEINSSNTYKEWFSHFDKSPSIQSWYDPTLIEQISAAKQKHEIASHSFTHYCFKSIKDPETAQFELDVSHDILSRLSREQVKTFIFPENQIYFLEEFKKSPYKIYRARDINWYNRLPFKRFFHFIDQLLPICPAPVEINKDEFGNYYVSGSILLFAYDGLRKVIPDSLRFFKIKRGIDRAISENKIFHLWFHPWNLGSSKRMIGVLERVLAYVRQKRRNGELTVATIGGLLPKDL